MYSGIHMSDQYNAIDNVIQFFVSLGPIQFIIYLVLMTVVGYYINKRTTQKK